MIAENFFRKEDEAYITRLRREIHEYPEVGFSLPKTVAVVKRELEAMGIPYTEKFGISSIVATINPDCDAKTVGIRADMDALPVEEKTEISFKSKIPGQMHACGHDAHTAILLGTTKALKRAEPGLKCRVKLLFQSNEEGEESGIVKQVYLKGYKKGDKVLRYAQVIVTQ